MRRHTGILLLVALASFTGCTDTQTIDSRSLRDDASTTATTALKSPKRGIAYDFASAADLQAVSPGVSWWYNWSAAPNSGVPTNYVSTYGMDFYPMLWGISFNKSSVETFIRAHSEIKYLFVLNEPNVGGQAYCVSGQNYCSPSQAAALWPQYEAVAADTGVQIVGPQMTWGSEPGYSDPVLWLDNFISAYQMANAGRSPRIDFLGFHWYDYGLDSQLSRLAKYGKPFWITEFANSHSQTDGAQIDSLAKEKAQMTDMVNTGESRADVFRYAWFTGRVSPDPHFSSLLAGAGQLTSLGQLYLTLPFTTAATSVRIAAGSATAVGSFLADMDYSGGTTAFPTQPVTLAAGDTATQATYQSNRYGNFTYTIPGFNPGSTHTVTLHFAEAYWWQSNQRMFNVTINGAAALSNFDIFATAGDSNKAVLQTFYTTANSAGQIVLQFTTVKDNAQINAIEIQ